MVSALLVGSSILLASGGRPTVFGIPPNPVLGVLGLLTAGGGYLIVAWGVPALGPVLKDPNTKGRREIPPALDAIRPRAQPCADATPPSLRQRRRPATRQNRSGRGS